MKCSNCGAEIREGSTFCHECGKPINQVLNDKNHNSYVLISGSDINLDDYGALYIYARRLYYQSILLSIFSLVPIIPLIFGIKMLYDCLSLKDRLNDFDNQTNIVNVLFADRIRSSVYNSLYRVIIVLFVQVLMIFIIFFVIIPQMNYLRGLGLFR